MGTGIEDPKKCAKSFNYGDLKICGYAFPSEPNCDFYNSNGPLIDTLRGGERTLHRVCLKPDCTECGEKSHGRAKA